jgi:cytolysin (calcineurin-like family phosphatase)
MIRKIASVSALMLTAVPMVALSGNMALASTEQPQVTVFNQGGYVADYQITYTVNGQQKNITTSKFNLGGKQTIKIPVGSQNVRVRGQMYTGLFWEPKRIIFDRNFSQAPSDACFKTFGTIFRSQWSNECSANF